MIYPYKCDECGREAQLTMSINNVEEAVTCLEPLKGQQRTCYGQLRRVFSPSTAFRLRGLDWAMWEGKRFPVQRMRGPQPRNADGSIKRVQ